MSLPIVEGVEFRAIHECIGYAVGDDGTVWSCYKKGCHGEMGEWWQMKLKVTEDGHHNVVVRRGGKRLTRSVHRLVLDAFVGPCPEGMECCHRDGNPANNKKTNLRWDTHTENIRDRIKHGTIGRNELHGACKLTTKQVIEIRELFAAGGIFQKDIAVQYGVTPQLICGIISKKYRPYA